MYAVHAALGLSVSDTLLQGCTSVVVEGAADQIYLSAIKVVLIARKKYAPKRELVFMPAGGAKGVSAIVPIVAGKDEGLPVVVLDDDQQGRQFAEALRKGVLYKGAEERVLNVREIVSLEHAEIEDLLPVRRSRMPSVGLCVGTMTTSENVVQAGMPIVPQIEAYARQCGVELPHGWKVDLAREVKRRLIRDVEKLQESDLERWVKLFSRFEK